MSSLRHFQHDMKCHHRMSGIRFLFHGLFTTRTIFFKPTNSKQISLSEFVCFVCKKQSQHVTSLFCFKGSNHVISVLLVVYDVFDGETL